MGIWKDLPRRATSDEVLRDKTFNIAKYLEYDDIYEKGFAPIIYKFFDVQINLLYTQIKEVLLETNN